MPLGTGCVGRLSAPKRRSEAPQLQGFIVRLSILNPYFYIPIEDFSGFSGDRLTGEA